MTRDQAIKAAKARVSKLIYCSGFNWQFTIDGQFTQPASHKTAQHRRAEKLVEIARRELGLTPLNYIGGSWEQYI
jgi:hypothetical protein